MENDENLELELEQPIEEKETAVEEPVADESQDSKDIEIATAKAEAAKYRRLFEKAIKPKVETPEVSKETSPQPSVEETVLLANGMPEELLNELKAIAAIRKVSLIKAQADSLFVAVKENFEKDQKQKEASLGASRGSGSAKPKMDFNTPNLPRETHKELFYKAMS